MVGYIGGANATLLKTTNGGSIWKHVDIKDAPWVFSKMDIIQMDFINKDTGYAIVGDHSRRSLNTAIWKTVDGGFNWTSIIVTVNMVPWRIYTTGIDTGFVAGTAYFQGSVISNLSGDSVVNLHSFSWDGANYIEAIAIHADNPSFVMAVTNVPSVHRSFDGGLSWDTVTSNIDTAFNDLAYVGNGTWVACTKSHESLQITKDSGKTWKWLPTTFAYPTYSALCISQRDSIVSVGYSGSLKQGEIGYFHRSMQRYQSVPQKMHDVACSSITTIAVGDSGAIYVKNDSHYNTKPLKRRMEYTFTPIQPMVLLSLKK